MGLDVNVRNCIKVSILRNNVDVIAYIWVLGASVKRQRPDRKLRAEKQKK